MIEETNVNAWPLSFWIHSFESSASFCECLMFVVCVFGEVGVSDANGVLDES
jgi:hypothetical protein